MAVRVLAVLGVSSSNASQSLDHMAPARVSLLDERDDLICAVPVVTPESSVLLATTKIFNGPSGGEWRMVVERVRGSGQAGIAPPHQP
jgi:hypothetical protein